MAYPHISYETFKQRFGDLGITEWTKYNYLDDYNFGLPAQSEVPTDEYVELEYLNSVGTGGRGYIDTQYVGKDNTTAELDVGINETTNRNLLGNKLIEHESVKEGMILNTFNDHSLEIMYRNSNWRVIETTQPFYQTRSKVSYGPKGLYINGHIVYDLSTITGNIGTDSFYLFSRNRSDVSDSNIADATIYNLKFYEGTKLVRDFHPVKRLTDGKYGLYDTVTNTFVEGTGTFIAGPMKQRYVRVEYVKFNTNDYIDTGIKPTLTDNYQFTLRDIYPSDDGIFGVRFENPTRGNFLGIVTFGTGFKLYMCFGNAAYQNGVDIPSSIDLLEKHNYQMTNSGTFIDGQMVGRPFNASAVIESNNTIYIGAYNNNGQAAYGASADYYNFKITQNGTLVRNFVPVYDLENEEYGLYDLVEGKYYGSAHGALTGPFNTIKHYTFTRENAANIQWYGDFFGKGALFIDLGQMLTSDWTYTWGFDIQNEWYYDIDSNLLSYREQNANHPNDTHNMNRGYVFVPPVTETEAREYLYTHPVEFWLFKSK